MSNLYLSFIFIFPLIFAVLGLSYLALGLCGLLTKKPFLLSSRWLFGLLLIFWIPLLLQNLLMPVPSFLQGQSGGFRLFTLLLAAMLIFTILFMWRSTQGYTGYGFTDSSLRQGLINVLRKLELPFEENLSGIYLSSVGANLQVTIQSWMGTAQINIRPRKFNQVLRDVINGMSSYYQTANVSINPTFFYYELVMGAFMLVFAVGFFGYFNSLRHF